MRLSRDGRLGMKNAMVQQKVSQQHTRTNAMKGNSRTCMTGDDDLLTSRTEEEQTVALRLTGDVLAAANDDD